MSSYYWQNRRIIKKAHDKYHKKGGKGSKKVL